MAYDIEGIVNPAEIVTLKSLNTEINESTTALIKFLELQAKYKTSVDNVSTSNTSATQKINEYSKIINKASDEQNKLTTLAKEHQKIQQQLVATEAKIFASKSETNKQLIEEKLNLQKATKEIQLKVKAQQAEKGSIEQLSAVNAILESRLKAVNLNTEDGKKKADLLTSAINRNNEKIKANSSELGKNKMTVGGYRKDLEGLSVKVDGLAGKFGALPGPLGKAAGGLAGVGKQLWALVANPIVAIVAGIVLAFTALVKIFKSTDEGANFLDAIFKSLGAILDVLKRRVLLLIDGFRALFSGNFKEAGEKFKETVSGVGKEIASTTGEAWNLVYALDALEDRMIANISMVAEYENKIARLRNIAKDQTKSDKEREEALRQALELERQLADENIKNSQQQYDIDLRNAARKLNLSKDTIDALIKMDANQFEEATKNNEEYRKIANQLGDEGVKKLEESLAKSIQADTNYYNETRRMTSELSGFQKELQDKNVAFAKEAAEKKKEQSKLEIELGKQVTAENQKQADEYEKLIDYQIEQDSKRLDNEVEASIKAADQQLEIRKLLVESEIRERQRQYEQELLIIDSTSKNETEKRSRVFELNKKYIAEDIALVRDQMNMAGLSAEQQIEFSNQLKDIELENQLLVADNDKRLHDEKLARQKELADGLVQLGSKIFEFSIANTNAELSALEEKNKKGIISEEEFNKKKAELELKKAKQEQKAALFKIAIDTAAAIMGSIKASPTTFGLPFSAFALATGLIEAGIVLKEPLPKYWTGTKNAKEVGIVGDRGRELATLTTGENVMFDKLTLYAGKKFKGMHVRTNAETERIMSATEHTGFGAVSFSDSKLLEKLDRVEKAITNKPVGIFQDGKMVGYQQNNYRETYLNRLKHG